MATADLGRRAHLALEALDELGLGQLFREQLQGDVLAGVDVLCKVDATEAPLPRRRSMR